MWQYSYACLRLVSIWSQTIADRRKFCDHMETPSCDPVIVIAGEKFNVSCPFMNIFWKSKPVFSSVLKLTLSSLFLGLKEEINCSKISFSISAMLFALIFARAQGACIFDISAELNLWLQSALRSVEIICDYKKIAPFAIVCDHVETSLKHHMHWGQQKLCR